MIPEDDRAMLIEELRDLVGIRIAIVLVPAMRALDVRGHHDLRRSLERFLGPLEGDLRSLLDKYEVRRKG